MPPRDATSIDEIELFGRRTRASWEWFEETVRDVDGDTANWWPPGTANSIGATYLHVVINADVELNRFVFGRAPLVETEYGGDAGQSYRYETEHFDRWVRHAPVDWERLREYGRAVHAALTDSLTDLGRSHLDRTVDMTRVGLGMWEGRDLLWLHGIEHPRIHGGEIACLKGLQGGIGWAESDTWKATVRVDDAPEV